MAELEFKPTQAGSKVHALNCSAVTFLFIPLLRKWIAEGEKRLSLIEPLLGSKYFARVPQFRF